MKELKFVIGAITIGLIMIAFSPTSGVNSVSSFPLSSTRWTEITIKPKKFDLDITDDATVIIRVNNPKGKDLVYVNGQGPDLGYNIKKLYLCLPVGQKVSKTEAIITYR